MTASSTLVRIHLRIRRFRVRRTGFGAPYPPTGPPRELHTTRFCRCDRSPIHLAALCVSPWYAGARDRDDLRGHPRQIQDDQVLLQDVGEAVPADRHEQGRTDPRPGCESAVRRPCGGIPFPGRWPRLAAAPCRAHQPAAILARRACSQPGTAVCIATMPISGLLSPGCQRSGKLSHPRGPGLPRRFAEARALPVPGVHGKVEHFCSF